MEALPSWQVDHALRISEFVLSRAVLCLLRDRLSRCCYGGNLADRFGYAKGQNSLANKEG